jgi:hypothetical protein
MQGEMRDRNPSEVGRRLASFRRIYRKTCPVCGREFEGIATRIYDRATCQVKASRERTSKGRKRGPKGETNTQAAS